MFLKSLESSGDILASMPQVCREKFSLNSGSRAKDDHCIHRSSGFHDDSENNPKFKLDSITRREHRQLAIEISVWKQSPAFRAANADFLGTSILSLCALPQEWCNCRESK
jgi:hypothetical protein